MFFATTEFRAVISALNSGFIKTLELFCITLVGALPLGLVIAFGSMSRWAPLKRPVQWYLGRKGAKMGRRAAWLSSFRPISLLCRLLVWLVRGTPLVLQIIVIFYVPGMLGLFTWGGGERARFTAVSVAFILNYAFYFSEIYRGGIQSVPRGQEEAGLVLGMTKREIFFHVTLLQMVKRIVPPMSNEVITLVKDTSLARVIALQEVIWVGESFMKGNGGYSGLIWPLFFTAVYYLVFSGVVTLLLGRLEKKLSYF